MSHHPILVPPRLRNALVESQDPRARDWCDRLPGLVEDLLDCWSCNVAAPVLSGWAGVVVPVRRHDGSGAMLKVSFPHDAYRFEATTLATWAGRGAALLLERDDTNFAMLLEALGAESLATVPDADEAMAVIGRLAKRLAVPAPAGIPRMRPIPARN